MRIPSGRVGIAALLGIATLGIASTAGAGERFALTDAQMDRITAGTSVASVSATAFAAQEAGGGLPVAATFSVGAIARGLNGALASVQATGFAGVTPTGAVAVVEVITIAVSPGVSGTFPSCGVPI